ncbi:MAG: flagellar motor switch protein FliG [Candidatus Eisenbacteria bacterium]|nr:flagellar motor switch protein FliG [Candidatus Eisenbacteria bacterium]
MPREMSESGVRKAAMFMVTVGAEAAASITKHLSRAEVEAVTMEIARTKDVPQQKRQEVINEFRDMYMAQSFYLEGGLEYAQEMLVKGMGHERAREILGRVRSGMEENMLEAIEQIEPEQLLSFIQSEHPQTMALILARLDTQQGAAVLTHLPQEVQPDVIKRMATMEQISQETFAEMDSILREQIKVLGRASSSRLGGVESVAEVLNKVDRGTEKNILGNLDRDDPELAAKIKNLMFVFEDIVHLMDRDIQQVLKEVDSKDLALALKVASEDVKTKVYNNMSQRASEMLRDEIEYLGPVRLKTVEESQQRIVEAIRRLEEQGKIVVTRGGEEEEIIV